MKEEQTKLHSLLESVNAAAFAAPTAIGLHKLMIWIFTDCARITDPCNNEFVGISWILFFFHSIVWKYVIRRIHEKYNIQLNPWYMIKKLRNKI